MTESAAPVHCHKPSRRLAGQLNIAVCCENRRWKEEERSRRGNLCATHGEKRKRVSSESQKLLHYSPLKHNHFGLTFRFRALLSLS